MMDRRDFSKTLLLTITGISFIDTLFKQALLAQKFRPLAGSWLKEMHEICFDLRTTKLSPLEWQAKIASFHNMIPLEDILKTIDFSSSVAGFQYPDLGVVTTDPKLPKIAGIEEYAFIGRIFGMKKDRAVIPHGHRNMTSCHRVLQGEFILRQYDRIKDEGEHMFIKQTVEEQARPGNFSSVSDDNNNVHWLVAGTEKAFTFDVIVHSLNNKPTEIDNIDIYEAVKMDQDILKVKKLKVEAALKKYGKSHH